MLCKDIMTKELVTAFRNFTVQEICLLMKKKNIGFIPVVYEDTDLIAGVVTDRDIVTRVISEYKSVNVKISDFLTRDYISVLEDEDISIAISKMADYQIRRILVTNKNKQLKGIISLKDLALKTDTNKLINELIKEICTPNPQVNKPLKYLKTEDFPL